MPISYALAAAHMLLWKLWTPLSWWYSICAGDSAAGVLLQNGSSGGGPTAAGCLPPASPFAGTAAAAPESESSQEGRTMLEVRLALQMHASSIVNPHSHFYSL